MRRVPRPSLDPPTLESRVATGLHKIGLALKHRDWLEASEHGLSPTQGQILAVLAGEGALTASEVSARLGVGLATISEAVTTLAAKGLVRRAPDARHPRARLLDLTASGRRRAAHARAWPEFLTEAVGTLTAAEQTTLLRALMKMIRTLQEQRQIPVQRMCVSCTHFRPHVRDGDPPHHCAFVDAPLGGADLRLDCRDHAAATPEQQQMHWARFIATP